MVLVLRPTPTATAIALAPNRIRTPRPRKNLSQSLMVHSYPERPDDIYDRRYARKKRQSCASSFQANAHDVTFEDTGPISDIPIGSSDHLDWANCRRAPIWQHGRSEHDDDLRHRHPPLHLADDPARSAVPVVVRWWFTPIAT